MPAHGIKNTHFTGTFHNGRISSVDKEKHTAQVQFFEGDGWVSWDLQILITRPGDYSLYAKDTPVLCLILDGRLGVGFVLGAYYTESDQPPISDDKKREIAGSDIRIGDEGSTVKVRAEKALVGDDLTYLGGDDQSLNPPTNGVVLGSGIDPFTGSTYYALQNASNKVMAKKA